MVTIEDLDHEITLAIAKANLGSNVTCSLKHSKYDPAKNHVATDYLCQNFGHDGVNEIELQLPICNECIKALYEQNWILFYCINCNHSQWVFRPYAKRKYPSGNYIYWFEVCPFCIKRK